jgi:hypothetical protein
MISSARKRYIALETDTLIFINSERSLEVLVHTDRKMKDQISSRTETSTKELDSIVATRRGQTLT